MSIISLSVCLSLPFCFSPWRRSQIFSSTLYWGCRLLFVAVCQQRASCSVMLLDFRIDADSRWTDLGWQMDCSCWTLALQCSELAVDTVHCVDQKVWGNVTSEHQIRLRAVRLHSQWKSLSDVTFTCTSCQWPAAPSEKTHTHTHTHTRLICMKIMRGIEQEKQYALFRFF